MNTAAGCGGDCANCNGGCPVGDKSAGSCSGYGGDLILTKGEIELLRRFAEIPFWPLCRRADSDTPICLEDGGMNPEILTALASKGLIRLDDNLPLDNFDYHDYDARIYPRRGSMALTAAGQRAADLLEIQGISGII